eukprot:gb/GECG01011567.1/.p1 GENE.gb/GECG01011567.1/~~gb/GECG01011567.1/.p1  ORF type:complete len:106 (+),score=21.84 gb/GECG01011567.1/:1-318(+)
MASEKDMVQEMINNNKVIVFSKTWCPFCTKAKNVFKNYPEVSPYYVELDQREDGGKIQSSVQEITGQRTVPNVIIAGKSIGGGDETEQAHRSGELRQKLKDAGVL